MHKLIFSVVLFFVIQAVSAQTPAKLSGTVIGTALSVDYDNGNQQSTTVNTVANCFDGDFNTYFASYQRSEGWVGLDLGAKHVISEVKWCPRATQSERVQLAVFEGANNPDFGDAVALYVIPEGTPENSFSAAAVNSSRGYRYVRYMARRDVRCNIAELEFWGYRSEGDNSHVGQVTNLPTVNIHTVENNVIDSRENYVKGIVSVVYGDYFHTDSLEIRGRGNASWGFPKKPYRMKLFNKTNLLGNPAKEKNWTLINNYGDKTLIRNLLAFDISKRMEMAYTPAGRPVDVVLNGEYVGTYQLCDHVEVTGGRIETDEMELTDNTLPNLSGGYLIEIDGYAYGNPWDDSSLPEPVKFTSNTAYNKKVPVTIKYPNDDEITREQWNYIENHFNKMEESVFAGNYADLNDGFRKYLDVPTLVRHFLIGEFSGNTDTYWSVYLYKKRNDDKFYFGPVWDFDIAFENDNRTHPIIQKPNWIYNYGSGAGSVADYVSRWLSDENLYNEVKTVYAHYRNSGKLNVESLLALIDNYAEEIDASQDLNFKRWDILSQPVHQNWQAAGSYAGELTILKNYIRERIAWMDEKLNYVPSSVSGSEAEDISIWTENGVLKISNLPERTKIACYDLGGRQIFETFAAGAFEKQLEKGIYLVKTEKQNGSRRVLKCAVK